MTDTPMMKCGHAANSVCRGRGGETFDPPIPSCAICAGLCGDDHITIDENPPDFTGRKAKCAYRKKRGGKPHTEKDLMDSSTKLAFFEHKPDEEFDIYYCGCWGWD